MEAQQDNSKNVWRLNEIKKKDYTDFRQLMDIALKNFSLEEKGKYVDNMYEDYYTIISSDYEDITSTESSVQLPYEIQFDDDDDFEQVLPKVLIWDFPAENDSSLCLPTSLDSDFEYVDYRSHAKPSSNLGYKKKKRGLWEKVKNVVKGLMFPRTERKQCKVTGNTFQELHKCFVEEQDLVGKVEEDVTSQLERKASSLQSRYL